RLVRPRGRIARRGGRLRLNRDGRARRATVADRADRGGQRARGDRGAATGALAPERRAARAPPGDRRVSDATVLLEVRGLGRRFEPRAGGGQAMFAIRDLSFDVRDGELLTIVG